MIYLIGEQPELGPVKIGFTRNEPLLRLHALSRETDSTRMPEGVARESLVLLAALPGDRCVEQAVHDVFAGQRLIGEWFDLGWSVNTVTALFVRAVREAQRLSARWQ